MFLSLLVVLFYILMLNWLGVFGESTPIPEPGHPDYEDYLELRRRSDEFRGIKYYDTYTPYPLNYKPESKND